MFMSYYTQWVTDKALTSHSTSLIIIFYLLIYFTYFRILFDEFSFEALQAGWKVGWA